MAKFSANGMAQFFFSLVKHHHFFTILGSISHRATHKRLFGPNVRPGGGGGAYRPPVEETVM
jgi:hypothetical protein